MKVNDIDEMHSVLLSMLIEFHKVCEKHHLRYYVVGGTCLGAIRHKGFIPWDDDVDLAMPREDYYKLCEMDLKEFPEWIKPRYYKTTNNSPIHFYRLVNTNTTLIEDAYHNYVEGAYLDIFPLDGVKKTELNGSLRLKIIWVLHAMIMKHCSTKKPVTLSGYVKNVVAKIIPLSLLHKMIEILMTRFEFDNSDYCINFLGAYGLKEIVPTAYFGVPQKYSFEGRILYGPEKGDLYMKKIYGDYLKLPPVEQQVCRHDQYYVNLQLPFEEYINNAR